MGERTTVNNAGTILANQPGAATLTKSNFGTITLTGADNTITNSGTIEARDGIAIQGTRTVTTGTVLDNSGVIRNSGVILSTADGSRLASSVVTLGEKSQVTNSGQILMEGGGGRTALIVLNESRIDNLAGGVIRATETRNNYITGGGTPLIGTSGVSIGARSTLNNAGLIDANATLSGVGVAVRVLGGGATITNSGTIDATTANFAIDVRSDDTGFTLANSGTLRGGSSGAIEITRGNNSVVTLATGSQISGSVSVREADRVLQPALANVPQCLVPNPPSACFTEVTALPRTATLKLDGTGTDANKFTGFNFIEKLGAGAWTLDTSLQAGSASDTYQTGDFRGALNVNVADAAGQFNLTGAITDGGDSTAGQLVKNGAGILALSGTNTYSGTTAINAGTLQANGGSAIGDRSAVTVASGATLALGAGETIGSLAGAGSVNLAGNALSAGGDNTSTTFSGDLAGSGRFEKYGTGALTLSGASRATGDLIVQEGTLNIAGSTPMRTTVGPIGTVIGNGTLGSLTNYGIVAPGNSVGTLNVTGNYFQASSGTYQAEIRPDGSAADLIAAGGVAVLAGRLTVQGENGALLTPALNGNTYTVLTAARGVTDQFNPVAPLGAFTFQTIYNPNNVQLGVTYAGFSAVQAAGVIPGTGRPTRSPNPCFLTARRSRRP